MQKATIILLISIGALLLTGAAAPQSARDDLDGVLKIAAYALWPQDAKTLKVVMAPQAEESYKDAQAYLGSRSFGGMAIELQKYRPGISLGGATVVYIEKGSQAPMEEIAKEASGSGALTITNDPGMLPLGCMFLICPGQDGRLDYTYNKQAVINSGLKMHISLMQLSHSMSQ